MKQTAAVLLAFAALPVLTIPAGPEPAKARLKRYEELAKEGTPAARMDAIRELRTADDPVVVDGILDRAFPDEDMRVARAGVDFLVRTMSPAAAERLREKGTAAADPRVRFHTLRTLCALEDKPAAQELARFAADAHWAVRLEAAVALGACEEDEAAAALRRLLGDREVPVRCAAVLALGDRGDAAAAPEIRRRLEDSDWRVRSAALEACVALKDYEAIPFLRRALAKETEFRLLDDLAEALDALGAARKEAIAAREAPEGASSDGVEEARTRKERDHEGVVYMGLRIFSGRVIFVLDRSKSMEQELREEDLPPPPKPRRYEVGGAGEASRPSEKDVMGYDGAKGGRPGETFLPTKLGFCQRELCRALRQLRPEMQFNVLCFQSAGRLQAWKPALQQASPQAVEDAARFVKRQTPEGETATYDALVTALGVREEDLFRKGTGWDPKVWPDTLVLLTDGDPTEGLLVQDAAITESIRRLCRITRTRIHTVGVGRAHLMPLQDIAAATGGRFVRVAGKE